MRQLHRKLLRDALHYRGQLGAISLLAISGVAVFVALRSMHSHLRDSRDGYYAAYRFADIFAPLKRAPLSVAREAAAIPGVRRVSARTVLDVALDVPGFPEPATGRLVSIPVPRAPTLNELHLYSGRWPSPDNPGEVIASISFGEANKLKPGDSIGAVIAGKWQRLYVTGIASSPEYIYVIGGNAIFPDNRRFGVLWMGESALQYASGMRGAFNDLSVTTAPGSEQSVIAALDNLLAKYGGVGAYGRSRHLSHLFISSEIEQTQVTSILLPAIFLCVTAFLLHLVLGRLVTVQREQIGALKAFGYGNGAIGLHYLQLALIPLLIGSVVGAVTGNWLAQKLAVVYGRFFRIPSAPFVMEPGVIAAGIGIGCLAGLVGAAVATRRTVTLPPAEAMRAESPERFSHGLIERLPFFRRVGPTGRITLRSLERRPLRTLSGALALALAIAVIIAARGVFDSVNRVKHIQFNVASREDVTVRFREARPLAAVAELRRVGGVTDVEGFRTAAIRIQKDNHVYHTVLQANDGGLHRIVDRNAVEHNAPPSGVLLSAALAKIIHASPGDSVLIRLEEGTRQQRVVAVSGLVDELLGTSAHMTANEMARNFGDQSAISGAYLTVEKDSLRSALLALKGLPEVTGVGVRDEQLRSFERTISESFAISLTAALGFACLIAFGAAYNGARVALSERGRELASLRVLGFMRSEVTRMLLGEQGALLLLSIPTGLIIGAGFSLLLASRFQSDLYRIPVVARPVTYFAAAALVTIFVAASGLVIAGRVRNLDMVSVLKTRE